MRSLYFRRLAWVLLLAISTRGNARVTRIELSSPAPESTRQVPADYSVLQGLAYGEVDPADPHNRIIQDIGRADKNSRGMVEYVATFTLYVPKHPAPKAVLLYDVVNRGGQVMPREYANGDFFLVSGWQGDIPFGGRANNGTHAEMVRVPIAHNADGSSITGPVLARFIDMPAGTKTLPLARSTTYSQNDTPPLPFDLDTGHASLITKQYEDNDGAQSGLLTIPGDAWSWGDCSSTQYPGLPDPAKICLRDGFNPALLYELRYTAKDPLVLGLGLAAMRDVNSFFRYQHDDGHGFINPAADHVGAAIATGVSQSGNTLRVLVNLGFNQDERNRIVFDGIMPIVSIRQTPINVRFAVPGGLSMLYELGTDGFTWWAPAADPVRGHPTGGELDRCTATHTCPKIMEFHGSTEFYSLRASLAYTGTTGTQDLQLAPNVRRYYFASTHHGGGNGGFYRMPDRRQMVPACVLAANPNPENPTRRALLLALKQWVVDGTEPPDSVYPSLRAGTLGPAEAVMTSFPRVPGEPLPASGALNPGLYYDFGSQFDANDTSGVVTNEPPVIIGATRTVLPTLDADGNEIGGIHSVQQQVPLGTYVGWNLEKTGFRKGAFCPLVGGYIPFAETRSERSAKHDPRPSVEERYGTHEEFVRQVREAAQKLVRQRFLLQDDMASILRQAEESDVLRSNGATP
jgi:hypothetical protein